jgi:hypothetical protein
MLKQRIMMRAMALHASLMVFKQKWRWTLACHFEPLDCVQQRATMARPEGLVAMMRQSTNQNQQQCSFVGSAREIPSCP